MSAAESLKVIRSNLGSRELLANGFAQREARAWASLVGSSLA